MYFGDLPRVFTKIVDIFEGLQTCLHAFKHKIHTYHKQVDQDIFISHVRLELAGQWNKLAIEYNRQLNILGYLVDFHTSMITTIHEEVGDSGQLIVERAQAKMLEISQKKENGCSGDSLPSSCIEDALSSFSMPTTHRSDDAEGDRGKETHDLPRVDSSLQQMRRMTLKYERTSRDASKRLFAIDGGVITSDSDDCPSGGESDNRNDTQDDTSNDEIECSVEHTNPMFKHKTNEDEIRATVKTEDTARELAEECITRALEHSIHN